jgi:hypothetical protein
MSKGAASRGCVAECGEQTAIGYGVAGHQVGDDGATVARGTDGDAIECQPDGFFGAEDDCGPTGLGALSPEFAHLSGALW